MVERFAVLLALSACGTTTGSNADSGVIVDAGITDAAVAPVDAAMAAVDLHADTDAAAQTGARMFGVTVDDISNLSGIVASLSALPHRPTTRIVFDEGQPPSQYASAVSQIHFVSDVMGEILDSQFVAKVSVADYQTRTKEYLAALAGHVDIWEVGNEINGNWVDTSPGGAADVVAKMAGAFDLVRAAGGRTALTLYGCSDANAQHDMVTWANANVPARMRTGLDYVLVSFYEGDCGVAAPDWPGVFHQLRAIFPTAALGFGEVGAVDHAGQRITDPSVAGPYLRKYYGLSIPEPGYVGGYFWWYFAEDMVPQTSPMFSVLAMAIQ